MVVGRRKSGTWKRRWEDCIREDTETAGVMKEALNQAKWRKPAEEEAWADGKKSEKKDTVSEGIMGCDVALMSYP